MPLADHDHNVLAWQVHDVIRADFLSTLFGPMYLCGESLTYAWARKLSPDYVDFRDCSWQCFQLSCGIAYLAPGNAEEILIAIPTHGFEARMTAGAFGIVVTSLALRSLADVARSDLVMSRYRTLRLFANTHLEAHEIFRAID
ncbi:antirestriction protein [Burkholderia glumae]|uniref:antirestriction protein n=1 Tax=Burkholderia glumae TaxID=337 RepID=UPI0020CF7D3C|nr:antirestriction protein [Burkholderia glumae]MCQ0031442.1 antirestriction protein [Burkholderia glumae]MCQ0035094.1 antirestriction protein [Burkholderia glumae]UVT00036.1 antirestriction protein [Burkholderia glumae]